MTVGPVVSLWRTARKTRVMPSAADLQNALAKVGYEKMTLDPKNQTVTLAVAGMKLDLGGIAKGDAGDQAIKVLRDHGITKPPSSKPAAISSSPTHLRIHGPTNAAGTSNFPPAKTTPPKNSPSKTPPSPPPATKSNTSSSTANRYSHIVNPHTGLGLTEHNVATIRANRGIESDALSKVATVLPPDQAKPIVESFGGKCWIGKSPTTTKPVD